MVKKQSASSRHEKRLVANELFTRGLSKAQQKELGALRRLPDSRIDLSDAPALKRRPAQVFVGKFYRPVKKLVSVHIDADVLDWFKSQGGPYQTRINSVLRREMESAAHR